MAAAARGHRVSSALLQITDGYVSQGVGAPMRAGGNEAKRAKLIGGGTPTVAAAVRGHQVSGALLQLGAKACVVLAEGLEQLVAAECTAVDDSFLSKKAAAIASSSPAIFR